MQNIQHIHSKLMDKFLMVTAQDWGIAITGNENAASDIGDSSRDASEDGISG